MTYEACCLCPRRCGVNRAAGERGFCGAPAEALVAKVMLHPWEEPVLSSKLSGAVFFGGCTLGCRYCQNMAISREPVGKQVDSDQLRQIFEDLIGQGAENIDLVTPTHYLPTVIGALQPKLSVPVIYNCGGYESEQSIAALDGLVDIYLPDMKYMDGALAQKLSGAADYPQVAQRAIEAMVKQVGDVVFSGEKMTRGVLIRHLILPGQVENSLRVLDWIGEHFRPGQVLVSLMRQYTPMPGMTAPFDRRVTQQEYEAVLSWMYLNRLEGFVQEQAAADACFIPEF